MSLKPDPFSTLPGQRLEDVTTQNQQTPSTDYTYSLYTQEG